MPDPIQITVSAGGTTRIGLVVRGKNGPAHHPGNMEQHADCVLSDGAPIGFFGEGNGGSANDVGLGMTGIVYDYPIFRRERPHYVTMETAIRTRVVSTLLLIQVEPAVAARFASAWDEMRRNPGNFNIVGGNCASHASAAFISAGVVGGGIPWLDTPDNLYAQLVAAIPAGRRQSVSGFLGFVPKGPGGGFGLVLMPHADTPAVTRPNPGTSFDFGSRG